MIVQLLYITIFFFFFFLLIQEVTFHCEHTKEWYLSTMTKSGQKPVASNFSATTLTATLAVIKSITAHGAEYCLQEAPEVGSSMCVHLV